MHRIARAGRTSLGLAILTLAFAACGPTTTVTAPVGGAGPIDVPGAGDAKVVVPRPGQLDVHPVAADTLRAKVDGREVVIAVDWWSGVEPCTILDSIVVDQGAGTFAITLREGRGPEDVACIAIAELHRSFIPLGVLEPGTYRVSDAMGGAPDIEIVVG